MVDTPSEGPPWEPSPWQRWQVERRQFDRDYNLRAVELDFRLREARRDQWLRLCWVVVATLALLAGWSVAWRYEDLLGEAAKAGRVQTLGGGDLAGPPAVVLPARERDVLAMLRGKLGGVSTGPGGMLDEAALIGLLQSVEGAEKLPAEEIKKLADIILDGGKEITVHGAEMVIDKLLGGGGEAAGGSVSVTQICSPSQVNTAAPAKSGGQTRMGRPPRRCAASGDAATPTP